ncbi:MAG: histone deacetylase [Acidobacteria bacterium]|nr:histone deacetylase [Acidobacteriota bacterium]
MKRIGFVFDEIFLAHKTGNHPESPERLSFLLHYLEERNWFERLIRIKPEPATLSILSHIHTPSYIHSLKKEIERGARVLDDGDTIVSSHSYEAALYAAGAGITASSAILEGRLDSAFCAVRPPGHHAERDRAMGFCLFNNIAVTASYLKQDKGLSRILIIDFDVHHGNGTQNAFYDDPSILYISLHQYPHYPGTGSKEERGEGEGYGFTINIPLPAGSDDIDYITAFNEKVIPAGDAFRPEFVLVSAGFDPHRDDPLSAMRVTEDGFYQLTKMIREIAERWSQGRIVSILEGGYNLPALGRSVEHHLKALIE